MTKIETFGTDIGPPCLKCNGTIYRYSVATEEGEQTCIMSLCVGCHRKTEDYTYGEMTTVQRVRAVHEHAATAERRERGL